MTTRLTETDPALSDFEERTARHLRNLRELTELGMDLARALDRQVTKAGRPVTDEVALAFSRIAREVCLNIAAEDRLAAAYEARRRPAKAEQRQPAPTTEPSRARPDRPIRGPVH